MKYFPILIILLFTGCKTLDPGVVAIPMRVNSYTEECVGEMQGQCLLVQIGDDIGTGEWEYLYYEDAIRGFEYEPGFIYNLLVRRVNINDPAMDSPALVYELIQVRSKENSEY